MPALQYVDTRGRVRHCAPRRKRPEDAPGEYVTYEDLHILAWLATHPGWCMAGRLDIIAAEVTPRRDWRGNHRMPHLESVRKTLHRLRERGLVRVEKPVKRVVMETVARRQHAKKVYKPDLWEITRAGYEHLSTEMSVRFFSPEVDHASWKHLLKMVKLARFDVIPAIMALDPKGGYAVYRIDRLIKATPIFEMPDIIKRAKKADNPCAYLVKCCSGPMDSRDSRRAEAWLAKVPFFQKRPDLVPLFFGAMVGKDFGMSKLGVVMRMAKLIAQAFMLRSTHTLVRPAHIPVSNPDVDLIGVTFVNAVASGILKLRSKNVA